MIVCCRSWKGQALIKLNLSESGAGPSLVLIHGWAMNNAVWGAFADELAQSYRVICVELPGHGMSEYTDAWTMDEVLQALHRQLPERSNILAWSLGGMLALAYAQRYPDRVDKLLMMASSACFVQAEGWLCAQEDEVLNAFLHGMVDKPASTIKRFLRLQSQGALEPRLLNRRLNQCLKEGGSGSAEGLISGLRILQQADLRAALVAIACPLLMILGDKDQLIPVAVGAASLELNAGIQLSVIEQASHVPFLSDQAAVLESINQFIATEECRG